MKETQNYKFGNSRPAPVDYVDASISYIFTIPLKPTKTIAIEVARQVIMGKLEYGFHNKSEAYKTAAYAMHILKVLNKGQL